MIHMNIFTKQKETHRFQKEIYGYQREKDGGGVQTRSLGLT